MLRQPDQILPVGAIAMHQHHQMGGGTARGRQSGTGKCHVYLWLELQSDREPEAGIAARPWKSMIVTRFAPSPTGLLHLGHAYAAITAYESGDDFLLRIEDIDKGRSRDKFIQAIFYDLKWLGLSWDEPVLAAVHPHGRLCRGAGESEGARPGLSLFLHPRRNRHRDRAGGRSPARAPDGPQLSRHLPRIVAGRGRAADRGRASPMPCGWTWPRRWR